MNYDFKIEITADMIHKLHLKNTHLLVYALLDYYTKKDGSCVHPAGFLADMLGLNVGTIHNCVRSLVLNHLIEVEKVITEDDHTLLKLKTI